MITTKIKTQGMDALASHYIADVDQIPSVDTNGSEQCTDLPEDVEDILRKFLYDLFDCTPLELLVFRSIMRKQTLTQFAEDMSAFFDKHKNKKMTRHHAFQLRKSLSKKLGQQFNQALLTSGQRKPVTKLQK